MVRVRFNSRPRTEGIFALIKAEFDEIVSILALAQRASMYGQLETIRKAVSILALAQRASGHQMVYV